MKKRQRPKSKTKLVAFALRIVLLVVVANVSGLGQQRWQGLATTSALHSFTSTNQLPIRRLLPWSIREDSVATVPALELMRDKGFDQHQEDVVPTLQPNDPGYYPLWGSLVDIEKTLGELQQQIKGNTLNARTVYVAVMDEGVISHPDLDANHALQYDRDFTGTPPPDPTLGNHATSVASICATQTNNALGAVSIAGFTSSVKVFSVRIFAEDGTVTLQAIIDAWNYIRSLVDQGVPVVGVACAFGGPQYIEPEGAAIKAVTDRGVVVFAGAGPRTVTTGFYPASYGTTNPMVIPVTSLTETGDGLDNSAWAAWGMIAAPRTVKVVVKPSDPNRVGTFSGVSASTGQPLATYALIRSLFPTLTPNDALRRLMFSLGQLSGVSSAFPDFVLFGKLNTYMAITKRVFLVRSQGTISGAVALDAVNLTPGPFATTTKYFTSSMSETTRLLLFAYNLDPNTPLQEITVRAVDSKSNGFTLPVQSLVTIPEHTFVTQVIVKLPGTMPVGTGDVQVTLTVSGQDTNTVGVTIK